MSGSEREQSVQRGSTALVIQRLEHHARAKTGPMAEDIRAAAGLLKSVEGKAAAWDRLMSVLMEKHPEIFNAAPSPAECVFKWLEAK